MSPGDILIRNSIPKLRGISISEDMRTDCRKDRIEPLPDWVIEIIQDNLIWVGGWQ